MKEGLIDQPEHRSRRTDKSTSKVDFHDIRNNKNLPKEPDNTVIVDKVVKSPDSWMSNDNSPDATDIAGVELSDHWTFSGDILVRHHNTPRLNLFSPDEDPKCPIPSRFF